MQKLQKNAKAKSKVRQTLFSDLAGRSEEGASIKERDIERRRAWVPLQRKMVKKDQNRRGRGPERTNSSEKKLQKTTRNRKEKKGEISLGCWGKQGAGNFN